MKKAGIKVLTFFVESLIAELLVFGVMNKLKGKTILGNKMPQKKKTYTTWKGNVVLGENDGKVA